jgi:hypothetical protein
MLMFRQAWQAVLAATVWAGVLSYLGLPVVLAVLVPIDVALVGLAVLRWRSLQTRRYG